MRVVILALVILGAIGAAWRLSSDDRGPAYETSGADRGSLRSPAGESGSGESYPLFSRRESAVALDSPSGGASSLGSHSVGDPLPDSLESVLPSGKPLPQPVFQVGLLDADQLLEFLRESKDANPLGIPFTKDQAKQILKAASATSANLRVAQSRFDKLCLSRVQEKLEEGSFDDAIEYPSMEQAQQVLSRWGGARLTWVIRQGRVYRLISLAVEEHAEVYRSFLARNEAASSLMVRIREVIDLGEYMR